MFRRILISAILLLGLLAGPSWAAFEIEFRTPGAGEDLERDLRAASLLLARQKEGYDDGQQVLAAARADYARLTAVAYDSGFFGPVVTILLDGREATQIPVVRAPARVRRVVVTVEPGPRFTFGRTVIAPIVPGTRLPDPFRPGAPATTGAIRDAVSAAVEDWRLVGHATAEPGRQQITANHPQRRLDVSVAIEPGPRLRFGDLRISGDSKVRHKRIRAIAGLTEGDVFDPEALERARLRLQRTGTFRIVSLREGTPEGDRLPIDVQVSDRAPRTLGFGAEISSTQGLTLSTYWIHRNLRNDAERIRLDAEVSGIGGDDGGEDVSLRLRYDRPATRGPDKDLYAAGALETLDEVRFDVDRAVFEIGFVDRESLRRTFSYGVGIEASDSTDAYGSRDVVLLTIPLNAEFDYRDDELNPTDGYFGNVALTPFISVSGGQSGLRALLDARYYQPFGDRLVFALRGQLGSLFFADANEAPANYLFYSGGGGTVRGQSFQALGVPVGSGVGGGRSFIGLSGELRAKTGKRLSVVGFVDAGYIGEESFPDGTSGDWHSGAGVGLRYDTGVGPIRFDVAAPVGGTDDSNGIEFYIGIGQAF